MDTSESGSEDGIQNNGEAAAAGTTVQLVDKDGKHVKDIDGKDVQDITIGDDSKYEFTNLAPGDYRVKFTAPEGHEFTKQYAGKDTTKDFNVTRDTGYTEFIHLNSGDAKTDYDAGIIPLKYQVTHTFVSGTEGKVLPDEVKALLPANQTDKVNGVTVNPTAPKETSVKTDEGTWTFVKYDAESKEIKGSDVNFEGNDVAQAAVDSENGAYKFENLQPGTYTVEFIAPDGTKFTNQYVVDDTTKDSNVDNEGKTGSISLIAGENKEHVDAGIIPNLPASISGKVWYDTNNSGIKDFGDEGIPGGIEVTLTDKEGIAITQDIEGNKINPIPIGEQGTYSFENLPAGEYRVVFKTPNGETFTKKNIGKYPNVDSDVDSEGKTDIITLEPEDKKVDIDAGVLPKVEKVPASISGKIWIDTNKNGLQDDIALEIPEGFKAILKTYDEKDVVNNNKVLVEPVTIGKDGTYKFENLPAGDYKVIFETPIGITFTTKDVAGYEKDDIDSDIDPDTKSTDKITLASNENKINVDAGILPGEVQKPEAASISGKIWLDSDENGIQGDKEKQIPAGLVARLLDEHDNPVYDLEGKLVNDIPLDMDGTYKFNNLKAGRYKVKFFGQDGIEFKFTQKGQGTDESGSDADKDTGVTDVIEVKAGNNKENIDAGVVGEVHKVTYEFKSDTNGKELPKEVKDLLPNDPKAYFNGTNVTPSTPEKTTVEVEDGTWTFQPYEKKEATIKDKDEHFIGKWVFEEKKPETGSVYARYVDTDGNSLLPDGADKITVKDNVQVGTEYTTEQKIFDGYEFVRVAANPADANGLVKEGDQTVTYVYKKIEENPDTNPDPKTGNVYVKYVDENGKSLLNDADQEPVVEDRKLNTSHPTSVQVGKTIGASKSVPRTGVAGVEGIVAILATAGAAYYASKKRK